MLDQSASTTPHAALKKVTHVIFDLDGLLLDTEDVYRDVITDIAVENGTWYPDEVRYKLLGTPDVDAANIAVKELKLPISSEEFLQELRQRSRQFFLDYPCPFLPGAEALVQHLHDHQVPIAVATSSTQASFEVKTSAYKDIFALFHHIVTGGSDPEVKSGKPSPDVFLVCASRFPNSPKPEQCLVFEDAPNGVTAAITAGMQCVMVPDLGTRRELTTHATLVLKSLEELRPEVFGLPPLKAA